MPISFLIRLARNCNKNPLYRVRELSWADVSIRFVFTWSHRHIIRGLLTLKNAYAIRFFLFSFVRFEFDAFARTATATAACWCWLIKKKKKNHDFFLFSSSLISPRHTHTIFSRCEQTPIQLIWYDLGPQQIINPFYLVPRCYFIHFDCVWRTK